MELSWSKLKVGWGSWRWTLAIVDILPSRLPNSTVYDGPPACIIIHDVMHWIIKSINDYFKSYICMSILYQFYPEKWQNLKRKITNTTTSLVARASISAQETLFLHWGSLSTAALALTTVSNPSPAREMSSGWSFSALLFGEESSTEASQPYTTRNQHY